MRPLLLLIFISAYVTNLDSQQVDSIAVIEVHDSISPVEKVDSFQQVDLVDYLVRILKIKNS